MKLSSTDKTVLEAIDTSGSMILAPEKMIGTRKMNSIYKLIKAGLLVQSRLTENLVEYKRAA